MTVATAQGIQFLNLAYFGRPADPASLSAWPASGLSLEAIVLQFTGTAEYATNTVQPNSAVNPGGGRTFNDTNLINTFYQRLFGRLATSAEVAGWADALARGAVNYDYLGITILQAGLNLPAGTEMRQVLIAKFDSNQLYTGILFNNPVDAAAYSTSAAILDGIAFSSATTTTTPQTLAQAQTAVTQMVADSGAGSGQAFTLTTSVETVPASGTMGANSTVNGTLTNGVANGQTFQTGDVINANATSDVNVNLLVDQANSVTINNARSVNFRNISGGNTTAANTNAILWNGVGTFSSTNSLAGQVGVSNGALATTYSVVNPLIDSGAGLNVTYRAADITGATDTAKFSVTGVGSTSNAAVAAPSLLAINNNSTGATATGVEIATVATSGTNNVNLNFGTDTSTVNVTGAGTNTLNMQAGGIVATAQTYNLSDATGNNTLDVAATLTSSSTVTGGSGADTLRVTPSGLAITNLSVSGVETLRLRNAGVAGTLGFAGTPSFGTIRTDAGGNAAVAVTLLNGLQSTTAIDYRGASTAATSANSQTFNALTATGATTGAADTLNLSLSNGGVNLTGAGGAPYVLGDLTANGIENVNVSIADAAAAGVSTINTNGIVSSTLTTFAATGASALNVTLSGQAIGGTGGDNLTTVNFSGLTTTTGASVVTTAAGGGVVAAASNFTAGAGGLNVVISNGEAATDVITFTGAAGADIFDNGAGAASAFTGLLNASLGAGNDTIIAAVSAGVVANGGDGNDALTGGAQIDTLRGDAGNDTITGGAAADNLTGGAGADSFVWAAGDSGQTVATADVITDYTTGLDVIRTAAGNGNTIGINTVAVATTAAAISATGVATFTAADDTFGERIIAVAGGLTAEAVAGVAEAAGQSVVFNGGDSNFTYLFVSDGVAGVTANDYLAQLTGVTTAVGITLSAAPGNITAIS